MPTIADITAGQAFRLDYDGRDQNGNPVRYAGNSYIMRADGRLVGYDGRIWSLAQCGYTLDTPVIGPVWGA